MVIACLSRISHGKQVLYSASGKSAATIFFLPKKEVLRC
jgi:hypothetical protein